MWLIQEISDECLIEDAEEGVKGLQRNELMNGRALLMCAVGCLDCW